jgi:hypothetical protein
MKVTSAALLLIGATNAVQVQSRSMVQTTLFGLENPVYLPQANGLQGNASNVTAAAQHPEGTSLIDTSSTKFKTNHKQTTLTIVQDFPKKPTEKSAAPSINLIQGKTSDVKILPEGQKTTLTIVQDFRKVNGVELGNEEMVMGKKSEIIINPFANDTATSKTLVITQDFAQ